LTEGIERDLSDSLISIVNITNTASQQIAVANGIRIVKETIYKHNRVKIFKIEIDDWRQP